MNSLNYELVSELVGELALGELDWAKDHRPIRGIIINNSSLLSTLHQITNIQNLILKKLNEYKMFYLKVKLNEQV